MKRIVLFSIMIFFVSVPSYSTDDPVQRGMNLYKRHHYQEAAGVLHSYLPSVEPGKKSPAYLTAGMVCLKNAELYRELYHASLSVHFDYLKRLSAVRGKSRSRLAKFYMGDTLLEDGKPGKAVSYFKKFIADTTVKPKYKAIAKIRMGVCYYLQGRKQEANRLWGSIAKKKDPVILSELAAAYSSVGLAGRNPSSMCEKALALMKKSGKRISSMRAVNNIIGVYARQGRFEKGFDLLRNADMRAFSYEEALVKNKVIRFYDLSLLNNLSMLYGKACLKYLNKATADAKVKDTAQYYLGEAYALFGSIDQSIKVTNSFISSARMPKHFKNMAKVRDAANRYRKGRKTEAMSLLNNLSRQQAAPYLLAEILFTYGKLKVECPDLVAKASALAEAGEGKRFSIVNFALGKYYLGEKDHKKAASYMEAGRDKSNKNRIEYNDPLMLVNLAEAYYRIKQFSEALEIYFEMSKHFPAIRQIQVAMQGIYSMEQKSAGDVKIF